MVVVKTVEEFKKKNENELKAFFMYQTGIYDTEIIKDTLQDFYVRLIQTKALEKYDENFATTEKGNILNYERWICNNFCWLLPLLRKKNYTSVLKLKLPKDEVLKLKLPKDEENKTDDTNNSDENGGYEVLRFISEFQQKDWHAETLTDIYDVINPEIKDTPYAINERFKVSMIEINEDQRIKENLENFFRFIKSTMSLKRSFQIETYMRSRLKGLNGVDIAIILKISSNMVKIIRQEAKDIFEKWLNDQVIA